MPEVKVVMPSEPPWELHEDGLLPRELVGDPVKIVGHPSL
jgi:hypothetical protein